MSNANGMRFGVIGLGVGFGLGLLCAQFFQDAPQPPLPPRQVTPPNPVPTSLPTPTPIGEPEPVPTRDPSPAAAKPAPAAADMPSPSPAPVRAAEHSQGPETLATLEQEARSLLERHQSPSRILRRLAEIGTPEAHTLLVDLYAECPGPHFARIFARVLQGVSDSRLTQLVLDHHDGYIAAGETSWVAMNPSMALLAEHGGDRGAEVLLAALAPGQRTTQATSSAFEALAHSADPRLLEAGLSWLRRPDARSNQDALNGLARAYGADGRARLLELAADPTARDARREAAAQAVASTIPPEQVSRVLAQHTAPGQEPAFVGFASGLGSRVESEDGFELSSADTELLRTRILACLVDPSSHSWRHALYAIEYSALFHTPAARDTLTALAARLPPKQAGDVRDALREVERTLGAR